MIRNAFFVSILAHLILISSLSELNVNADKSYVKYVDSSDFSSVLKVRINSVKKVRVERFGLEKVGPETSELDPDPKNVLNAHGKDVTAVTEKRQLGIDQLPLLNSGMVEVVNIHDENVILDSYFKSTDVDMSVIPLHELRLDNKLPISSVDATWYLRIFVDQYGIVKEVLSLEAMQLELSDYSEVVARVEHMQFIPAKKNGVAVKSYIDVALEVPN
jgi:hypothetical protein